MRQMTTCVLIAFSPDAHEAGQDPVSRRTEVKCREMAVTLAERYQAGGEGLSPQAKLLIPYDRDYRGEREVKYGGERWTVLTADPYKDWNGVLLSIRRKKGNSALDAGPAVPASGTGAAEEVGG